MRNKYKVTVVLFLEIAADQHFLLRLQIEWVTDLPVVFFRYQLFRLSKAHVWDLADGRKIDAKHIQFLFVL